MADNKTVVALIEAAKSFFEKKGIRDTARLDAELLLAEVLRCRRIDLYLRFDQAVADPGLSQFRELVRRRGNREPVKQILGRCEFMSREFEVTPDVLIPRPETETVVEQALAGLGAGPRTAADVGTGCGNIAVSIALARPDATVWATDISPAALDVARRNVERHKLAERVRLLEGDLLEPLAEPRLAGTLDCVVSNPPYVAKSEAAALMPEVAQHEPQAALFSGGDGMEHTLRLIAQAPAYLRPGGRLVLETCPQRAERTLAAAQANAAYETAWTVKDLGRAERVLIAQRGPGPQPNGE